MKDVLDLASEFTRQCELAAEKTKAEGNRPWSKKIESDALAVHPDQIAEVVERNRKHGLHIHYLPDGRPVLEDRAQRRRLMKVEGVHDRRGGYGDG